MQQPHGEGRKSSRVFYLRVVPLIALALINLLFLAMLDTLFANKKRALIIDSKAPFLELVDKIAPLQNQLDKLLNSTPNETEYLQKAKEYLDKHAEEILAGDHPWFRIVLEDSNQHVVAEYNNPGKKREYNDASNCLFSRSFEAPMSSINRKATLYYATPKGWPSIESMVFRYWVYAALFMISTALVYLWLYRNVMFPLQRVGGAIERMVEPGAVSLIDAPQHDIEQAFNRLARIQREVYFGLEVERLAGQLHDLPDDMVVLERFLRMAPASVASIYPFDRVEAFEWTSSSSALQRIAQHGDALDAPPAPAADGSIEWVDRGHAVISLRAGGKIAGCLRCRSSQPLAFPETEWRQMADEIQKQCETGLSRAFTRSQALTEERNRFGINLATNMGHDLTNIIATGKWDLDTIQRAQALNIIQLDGERGRFFEEAVEGLRNNLYFLQEMVNIYRSFGYARRPRYEETDLAALTNDLAHLFRLSTSREFELNVNAPQAAPAEVEPRLLRMALFNLLANSSQAIQRGGGAGAIEMRVDAGSDGMVSLSVLDNGPGIRDAGGELLPQEAINRIFQSGYTTKEGSSGGGLGLAWVRSIVEEFHGGRIEAANRPEGGARITLVIPCDREKRE